MSKITAAMIMGAGLGIRMRPLTDDRPKPLVTVGGKTLIDHAIDRLVAAGVLRVVVNLHYKADMLRRHLAKRHDVEIVFSDESDRLLDTGGGVVKAMPYLGDAPFFVVNSDSIWIEKGIPALTAMMAAWDERRMDGLLLLADMQTAMGYEGTGDFVLKADGRLVRARGIPAPLMPIPGCRSCIRACSRARRHGAFSTNVMWDRAIAAGTLFGTVLDGVWIHVGTPEARDEAEALSPLCRRPLKHPSVFTIAASAPFAETLARGLIARAGDDPLALSSAVIYLPTRRAARSFGDAFARDGRRGAAAAIPRPGRQRGRRSAVRRRRRAGTGAGHRAAAAAVAAGAAGAAMGPGGTRRHCCPSRKAQPWPTAWPR